MEVNGIPAFDDNYIWAINEGQGRIAVVDPGDADPVLDYVRQHGVAVSAILITHKHYDHVGGIVQLKAGFPDCVVYGPANETISGIDVALQEQSSTGIHGLDFSPAVLEVPGHTEGHIAYYGDGVLFCGDTLFACGCGRVFSGTMQQLHDSLRRIAALPDETRVYCAHEYTHDNIGFALWVEPENPDLIRRDEAVSAARERKEATVPSLLREEKLTNPFLRSEMPSVIEAAQRHAKRALGNSTEVFTELRQWKDREYD